jgi:DNA-binding SARP family transcriptional activator
MIVMLVRNPILELSLTGAYALALERYAALPAASAEDDRWAGACLVASGQFERAKVLLSQAVRRGCLEANIQLALAYGALMDFERAESILARVNLESLSAFDQVLAARAAGTLALTQGQRRAALAHLERGWQLALGDDASEPLRSSVAQSLAILNHLCGRDARAETLFELALPGASGVQRVGILSTRALSRTYLGLFVAAESDLREAQLLTQASGSKTLLLSCVAAILQRARGDARAAVAAFSLVARSARAVDDPETELYAELDLMALQTELDSLEQAQAHLMRAQQLSAQPYQVAMINFRSGALLARQSDVAALPALESALLAFTGLSADREAAWTCLHIAEAGLRLNQPDRTITAIRQVLNFRNALGPAVLNIELRTLPVLLEHLGSRADHVGRVLFDDWRAGHPARGLHLELRFFGDAGVFVDGAPVKLRYKRSLEVLAHLVLQPSGSMKKLLTDLFADEPPATARSYVHQVRYDLEKSGAGLRIEFDRVSRKYALESDGPKFVADVLEFQTALAAKTEPGLLRALDLYRGVFLASSENDWVREQREALIWAAIRVGLELIEGFEAQHQFENSFALSGRLLELDPFNAGVAGCLVRAAKNLNSESARLIVSRLRQKFATEFGEVPSVFEQF